MERGVDWARLRDQAIVALAAVALIWASGRVLEHFLRILVLVMLAVLIAFALEPPLSRLDRFMPRWLAALSVYAVAAVLLAGLGFAFGPQLGKQATSLAQHLPGYVDQAGRTAAGLAARSGLPVSEGASPSSQLAQALQGGLKDLIATSLNFAGVVVASAVDVVMVLVMSLYFMVDGARIRRLTVQAVPSQHREKVEFVERTITTVLGSYIRGQLILAMIIGVAAGIGCWLMGVRYPLVIAVLAFLFELVPMVGPVLTAIPAVVIASFQQPFPLVLYVVAYFFVIQQLENNVLAPRISGHAVGLHPLAALIALLAGADLFGIFGALFAVPIAGIAAVLVTALYKGWRGEPVVIERAGTRLRLPSRRRRRRMAE